MAIVKEVHVLAVRDGGVIVPFHCMHVAVMLRCRDGIVLIWVIRRHHDDVFIIMTVMGVVHMTIMQVIHITIMRDSGVTAIRTVCVVMHVDVAGMIRADTCTSGKNEGRRCGKDKGFHRMAPIRVCL